MNSTMIFNNDGENTIYTLQNSTEIFYLTINNSLMENFKTFVKLHKEDNEKKGVSEIRNETPIRKQLLEDVKKTNILIKDLNSKYVYSRINNLPELPVDKLENVLNPNIPFDLEKYKLISKEIEEKVNEAFKLMTSSNIKKESMTQVLLLVNEKEIDKNFIQWLTFALPMIKSPTTLEELRKIYKRTKIKYSLINYQTITTKDGAKFIAGLDVNMIPYAINIPPNDSIERLFQNELITIPIETFDNKSETEIATIIFTSISLHYKKEKMNYNNNYLVSESSNVSIEANKILGSKEEESKITEDTVKEDLGNVKTRVLVPPKQQYNSDNNAAFIKVGTIILFSLSFILIIISVILLITS